MVLKNTSPFDTAEQYKDAAVIVLGAFVHDIW